MSEFTPKYNAPRDRRQARPILGAIEPRPMSDEAFSDCIDALDHIARTCRKSATDTRRLRWIESRAVSAIEGSNDWRELPLPKTRSRVQLAEANIAAVLPIVTHYAEMLREGSMIDGDDDIRDPVVLEELETLDAFIRFANRLPSVRVAESFGDRENG